MKGRFTMPNTLIDLIIPMSLDEYFEILDAYEEIRNYWADKGKPNFQLRDFLYLGCQMYRNTYREGYALLEERGFAPTQGLCPCPFLDNTETT